MSDQGNTIGVIFNLFADLDMYVPAFTVSTECKSEVRAFIDSQFEIQFAHQSSC